MSQTFNIYCDESCHMENDHQKIMVLGAVWCPIEKVYEISNRIREIKVFHSLKPEFEIKWMKVSAAKLKFYLHLVDFFFDDDDLHFRALIVPDQSKLRHGVFKQRHDDWYYKMYFDMLKVIINPDCQYCIYLVKDTRGEAKVKKLHDVLCNNMYDFPREIIEQVQMVPSHAVEILQIVDLMVGAISYVNRGLTDSSAKLALVERIRERSGYELSRTTLLRENKVNLLRWNVLEVE